MVFTNAIDNQIPNSVLRGQGYNSFNVSPERRGETDFVYTGPGGMPSGLPEIASFENDPYAWPKALAIGTAFPTAATLAGAPALALVPPVIDIGLATARGAGKGLSFIPGLGPEFAKGVERTIPEPFLTRSIQNIVSGGNREALVKQVGELPFAIGDIGSNIGSTLTLAKQAPGLFKAFDVATDIASGTPGASAFLGRATTPLGAVGRGAAVGAAGSLFPAIDVGYNATEGTTNIPAAALTVGLGGVLGAGVGGAIPAVLSGKKVVDDIWQTVKKRVTQSDAFKTAQEITKRRYEAVQAQQMAAQRQMEQMPFQEPVDTTYRGLGVGEQTVAPRSVTGQEQIEPSTLLPYERAGAAEPVQPGRFSAYDAEGNPIIPQKPTDTLLDEVKFQKELDTEDYTQQVTQMENELDNISKEIGRTRKKKITLTKDEYKEEQQLYRNIKAKEKEYKPTKDGTPEELQDARQKIEQQIEKIDSYLASKSPGAKQNAESLKQKRAELQSQLKKNKIASRKAKQIAISNKQLENEINTLKAQAEDFRASRIAEREQARQDQLAALEKRGDELLGQYDTVRSKYDEQQKYLNELQGTLETEQNRNLPVPIAKESTMSESTQFVTESGLKGPVSEQKQYPLTVIPKQKITQPEAPEGAAFVTESGLIGPVKQQAQVEAPIAKVETETPVTKPEELTPERIEYDKDAKVNRWKPVVDEVARLSKDVGAMMYNFAVRPGIYKAQLLEQVKPLINVIKKYSGDTAVMKNLANIGRLGYDALPPDLARQLEALQPFFKAQAEAMNKAGMDIDLVNGIYFPRGWSDIKELQTRLGSQKKAYESDSGFLTDEQEVNFENRYLTRELEKSKTIPEVTDDIIDLFDPMQGINNWLDNISEKQAEIDLFGNATGNLKENIINLVSKNIGSFKSKEDAQKAILLMGKAIASRSSKVPNSYKTFSSFASAVSFTGSSTLTSQFLDIPLSMARNGLINALDGVVTTIATVFPQYKGQMKQILKDAGLQDAIEAYMDTGQFESLTNKTAKLFKLAQDKRYSEAFKESLAASGLSLNKFIYIGTRLGDAFGKKSQIVARHRRLQANPDLILEDIDRFVPDQKERQLVIDFYKGYKTDKKNQSKKPLPAPVIAYLVNTGLKYTAKTRYDRALVSLTGDSIERAANFAYTFSNKYATALRTDLKNLTKEVTTSKNPAKVAKKLLEVAAGAGTVIGATVGLGLYRSGYIGNEEQNIPITGDALGKTTLEAVGGMAAPYITRAVKAGAAIKDAKSIDQLDIAANALIPTSGTLVKTGLNAAQLALQGTPQDIYNREVNPTFRYMPPRLVTELVYRQSNKYKEDMANKALTAMQQPYAQEKSVNDQQVRADKIFMVQNDLLGSNLLNNEQKQKLLSETRLLRERKPGTVAYNTALANAEQTISNLRNYGTADLQQATTAKGGKFIADARITRAELKAAQLLRDGAISPEEYAGIMMAYKDMRKGYNVR